MQRYITHRFAHLETLTRAKYWLVQLGIDAGQIEADTGDSMRICVRVEPEQAAGVNFLFDALELADPDGWPGFWAMTHGPEHSAQGGETHPATATTTATTDPIGWHPVDGEPPETSKFFDRYREALQSPHR